ncbi:MAG: DsrE family protein [Promethearchaeota archaeon]
MDNFKKIVCLMLDSPYQNPMMDHRLKIIENLAHNSESIILFHYFDGVHLLNNDQAPKNFTNIGRIYEDLYKKYPHIEFYACSRCTGARGYIDLKKSKMDQKIFISSKLLHFTRIVSVRILGELLSKDYHLIQI